LFFDDRPWKSPAARCDISAALLVHMLRLNVARVASGRATGTFLGFAGLRCVFP
jgi:hypothetical protein